MYRFHGEGFQTLQYNKFVVRSGGRGLRNLFTAVANHVAASPRGLGNLFTAVANHVAASPLARRRHDSPLARRRHDSPQP